MHYYLHYNAAPSLSMLIIQTQGLCQKTVLLIRSATYSLTETEKSRNYNRTNR